MKTALSLSLIALGILIALRAKRRRTLGAAGTVLTVEEQQEGRRRSMARQSATHERATIKASEANSLPERRDLLAACPALCALDAQMRERLALTWAKSPFSVAEMRLWLGARTWTAQAATSFKEAGLSPRDAAMLIGLSSRTRSNIDTLGSKVSAGQLTIMDALELTGHLNVTKAAPELLVKDEREQVRIKGATRRSNAA